VIIKGKMSGSTIKFFTEELYGFKTLQRLDENSQLVLSNILDEVNDKILPIVERTLLLLSEVRGLVRAKQI
jgi:Anaphase-promoting complex, cyclosome, subunit 4